jgi:hypothetical protein
VNEKGRVGCCSFGGRRWSNHVGNLTCLRERRATRATGAAKLCGWIAHERLAVSVLRPCEQHQAKGVREVRKDSRERADDGGGAGGAGEGASDDGVPQESRTLS